MRDSKWGRKKRKRKKKKKKTAKQQQKLGIPVMTQWLMNPTSILKDWGLIPDLAQLG